jgi:hypothetical protein
VTQAVWLEGADPGVLSDRIFDLLERKGAEIEEHTPRHIVFARLAEDASGATFPRAGTLTLFKPTGENEIEMRLRLYARGISRLFWWTFAVEAVVTTLLIVSALTVPYTPGLLFETGLLFWLVFLAVGAVYAGTWPRTRTIEAGLAAAIVEACRPYAERVLLEEDRIRAQAEDEIEADLLERKLGRGKKARESKGAPPTNESPPF